jgi:hypothetical protein
MITLTITEFAIVYNNINSIVHSMSQSTIIPLMASLAQHLAITYSFGTTGTVWTQKVGRRDDIVVADAFDTGEEVHRPPGRPGGGQMPQPGLRLRSVFDIEIDTVLH